MRIAYCVLRIAYSIFRVTCWVWSIAYCLLVSAQYFWLFGISRDEIE